MTISKNNSKTCIIGGFEKKASAMSSFKMRRNRICSCWPYLIFKLLFFSTVKFKDILG